MQQLGKKIIYQIYPKSFYDSNGDGIGDIRGIIKKIPYIKKLNIDMIWFNPFFVSPQKDNGYDIADYYHIDPLFGTMRDFEELVLKLKKINVEVMLDMVFNHCSTQHEWFKRALAGEKKYQDYFYIRNPKSDGTLPTNWHSKFGGPAWEPFGNTGKYYLHLYDPSQADLDWHNPNVRKEASDIINFWRNKGVKGFRFDVFNVTGKSKKLVDSLNISQEKLLYTDTPIVEKYLQELNRNSFGKDIDSITVGEMSSTTIEKSVDYTKPENHELSMVFTFHHLKVDYKNGEKWNKVPFDFMKLKHLLNKWQIALDKSEGWTALFWNNHDQPRALNRFGDCKKYREKSAEMLATSIHLLRGTPYIYQGEEIGMTDPDYESMEDYVDIESHNAYKELLKKGTPPKEAFEIIKTKSRDNSRTPMQWDNSINAGFSSRTPWLKPTNQQAINVEDELAHGEIFNYYQKLIHLRKNNKTIILGHYLPLLLEHPKIFAYQRVYKDNKIIVINNFYGEELALKLPDEIKNKNVKTLISNYNVSLKNTKDILMLKPYESMVFEIKQH